LNDDSFFSAPQLKRGPLYGTKGPSLHPALEVVLPPYERPRNAWRAKIHAAAATAMQEAGITYSVHDWLTVNVQLVMTERMLRFHDVDNRLKDILDALQARIGGPKKVRILTPLVPNDFQVLQATVEKVVGQVSGGRLTIQQVSGSGPRAV
jgi:Holliday junction resolvase RusA-like endonuclease